MSKRRARRAPSADWLAMTPEDRKAAQAYRMKTQMPGYYQELRAAGQPFPTAQTNESKK